MFLDKLMDSSKRGFVLALTVLLPRLLYRGKIRLAAPLEVLAASAWASLIRVHRWLDRLGMDLRVDPIVRV
jgi:hypothetical protein